MERLTNMPVTTMGVVVLSILLGVTQIGLGQKESKPANPRSTRQIEPIQDWHFVDGSPGSLEKYNAACQLLMGEDRSYMCEYFRKFAGSATFGPNFAGDDVRAVVTHLPAPKSKFETTEDFQARMDSFATQHKPYVFVAEPEAIWGPNYADEPVPVFQYRADEHVFYKNILWFDITIKHSKTISHHIATNAFGVRKVVTTLNMTSWSLLLDRTALGSDDVIEFPMSASEARSAERYLRVAFECTISPVFTKDDTSCQLVTDNGVCGNGWELKESTRDSDATVSNPTEMHSHYIRLPVKISKVCAFDVRTGRVLFTKLYGTPESH